MFKVGDKVRIKENAHAISCDCYFSSHMEKHCGKVAEIQSVASNGHLYLALDDERTWYWHPKRKSRICGESSQSVQRFVSLEREG